MTILRRVKLKFPTIKSLHITSKTTTYEEKIKSLEKCPKILEEKHLRTSIITLNTSVTIKQKHHGSIRRDTHLLFLH
jgi:hypothetical protein